MNRLVLLFAFFFSIASGYSIELSEQTEVSLLTCAEGEEIYSLFGHSALRVRDPQNNIDKCYNWGMFEFDEDQIVFATKFTKGRLKYYMDEQEFQHFMFEYEYTNRNVKEQLLNLTQSQKVELWKALKINYLPENRVYKYDFFFDNCSSRIRDILQSVLGNDLVLEKHPESNNFSLRQLLNRSTTQLPWLIFGMDLALGSKVDNKASSEQMMFLPKYMYEIFSKSHVNRNGKMENFVLGERTLIAGAEHSIEVSFWSSPNTIFWSLFIFTMLLSILKIRFLSKLWDGLLLFVFGLLGLVILYLWFGTDHETMRPNYNILWASPIHLFFIIPLISKKIHDKLSIAYLIMAILLFIVIIGAMVIPQEFNSATTPIILLFTFKYFYWYKQTKKSI